MKRINIKKAALMLIMIPALVSGQIPADIRGEELSAGDEILSSDTAGALLPADADHAEVTTEELLASGEEEMLSAEEGTEEGISYIKGRPLTDAERLEEQSLPVGDEIPLFDVDETGDFLVQGVGAATASYYNAADLGYVTSVKNQGSYNNCWAFSLASLMETSLITQGYGSAQTLDLSEEHLSWYFSNRQADRLGNSAGDYTILNNGYKGNNNPWMVCMHLSTWSGMAVESDPIPGAYDTSAYLKDALFVRSPSVSEVKALIQQYKSVGALTYFNANSAYYNPDTAALCNASASGVNHAITIVGWDDNYSYRNFSASSGVTSNGAWIVKNSYGPSKGDQGYIYVSYSDASLTSFTCVTAQIAPNYQENYFYDGTSYVGGSYPLSSGNAVACVYKAEAGGGYVETLGEVVLSAASADAAYGIQIYTGITDPSDPVSGSPAYANPVSCHVLYPGIATIKVPEVDIAPGTCYSVVITNNGSSQIRFYIDTSKADSFYTTTARVEAKQSFYRSNNVWKDFYGNTTNPFSVRIKAHTKATSVTPFIEAEKSSLTLEVGNTYPFVPVVTPESLGSSGYTYTSSNPDIVSVSENGTVSALACGNAVLTAVCKEAPDLSVTMAVKAVPPTPQNVKASAQNVYQIRLSWNKVEGADGYRIYRKDGSGSWFVRRTITSVNSLSYTDQDNYTSRVFIVPKTKYQYYVVAYKDIDGVRYQSPASPVMTVTPDFAAKTVATRTYDSFYNTVQWYTEQGASGYYLDRSCNGGPFVNVGKYASFSGSKLSYTDHDVQRLQRYVYRVRPYRIIDGKECFGRWLYGTTIRASAGLTWIRYATAEPGKITVSFNYQPACNGYYIYRKPYGGSYQRIAILTDSSASTYVDTSVVKGVRYQYAVRAYVKEYYGGLLSTYRGGSFVTAK